MEVISFKLQSPCSRENSPRYPLNTRLEGLQSKSGREDERRILIHAENRTQNISKRYRLKADT